MYLVVGSMGVYTDLKLKIEQIECCQTRAASVNDKDGKCCCDVVLGQTNRKKPWII